MLNLPRWNRMISRPALTLLLGSVLALPAMAQDTPRYGGELLFVVAAQPPSFTFAVMHPLAPHYNTLLRVAPTDPTGTKIIADLADSWTISKDGRQYSLNLRRGVKFHDGSEMTSQDVKATYDKIINPPAGVVSARKGEYVNVEAVEASGPPQRSSRPSLRRGTGSIRRTFLPRTPGGTRRMSWAPGRSPSWSTSEAPIGWGGRTRPTGIRGSHTLTATAPFSSRTLRRGWQPSGASGPSSNSVVSPRWSAMSLSKTSAGKSRPRRARGTARSVAMNHE